MQLTYRLSKRQVKELERGNVLSIAIPAPREDIDADEYFGRHVSIPTAHRVELIEEQPVWVNPLIRPSSLASVLGEIVNEEGEGDPWLEIAVDCIIAKISNGRQRRSQYPTQWPGSVQLPDGRVLPAGEGEQP